MRRSIAFGLLTALALATTARTDEVILDPSASLKVPGGRIVGQITSESPTAVKIKPETGAEREVPVEQIASINYTGQPASLPLAETRENNGALAEALEQYRKAAGEAASKPYVTQAAQFGAARVQAGIAKADPSKLDEAIAALDTFVKTHRASRHLAPALEQLARLALNKGDNNRTEEALKALAAIPWAADRAAVLQARLLAKKGQGDQALQALEKVIGAAPKGSSRAEEARLARAEVLSATGKFADAEAAAREVIRDTPPESAELQALAHNTLGDCLRAAGKTKDALFAYLETDILYDADKEQHAKALYYIAQLWRELKQQARADEVMGRLRERYPQSPYLSGAQAVP
jgi:tetratricopeptide (TPR) repeat protein